MSDHFPLVATLRIKLKDEWKSNTPKKKFNICTDDQKTNYNEELRKQRTESMREQEQLGQPWTWQHERTLITNIAQKCIPNHQQKAKKEELSEAFFIFYKRELKPSSITTMNSLPP